MENPSGGANATLSPMAPSMGGFQKVSSVNAPPRAPSALSYVPMPTPPPPALSTYSGSSHATVVEGFKPSKPESRSRSVRSPEGSVLGLSALGSPREDQPEEILSPELATQARSPLPVATSSQSTVHTQSRRGKRSKSKTPHVTLVNHIYHTGDVHVHTASPASVPSAQYLAYGHVPLLASGASPWGPTIPSVVANPGDPVIPSSTQFYQT